MTEKPYCFGKDSILTGVLSAPDSSASRDVGVLILNAGLLHHVGPFRLHVDLARRLTAQGYSVLRLDRSGVGDSAIRKDLRSDEERAVLDAREAMDFMSKQTGLQRFMLIGLCAGAYHAHAISVADPRVVGAVFLDGYGYRTSGFYLRKGGKLLDSSRWTGFIKRKAAGLFEDAPAVDEKPASDAPSDASDERAETYVTEFPTQDQFVSELRGFVARGMKLLYVYTGGVHSYYNYAEQFSDMIGSLDCKGLVQTEFLAQADHTYPMLQDRAQLIERISGWLTSER